MIKEHLNIWIQLKLQEIHHKIKKIRETCQVHFITTQKGKQNALKKYDQLLIASMYQIEYYPDSFFYAFP